MSTYISSVHIYIYVFCCCFPSDGWRVGFPGRQSRCSWCPEGALRVLRGVSRDECWSCRRSGDRMAGMHPASEPRQKTLREARVTAAPTTLCRGKPVLWRSARWGLGGGGRWGEGCGQRQRNPGVSQKGNCLAQLARICLQCGRPGFDPWVGKIPWRRERLSTPVFWPGEFHGLYSLWGHRVGHD